jgi:hypothetical protein
MPSDLRRIAERAKSAYDWLMRDQRAEHGDGFLPLSVREHFTHDVPELIERITRYEHAITWGTTCLSCSTLLDKLVTAEEGAELLVRQQDDLLARCAAAEKSGSDTITLAEVYATVTGDPADDEESDRD